jgi:hypothetical protein
LNDSPGRDGAGLTDTHLPRPSRISWAPWIRDEFVDVSCICLVFVGSVVVWGS